jgi:hypothetical protein
VCIRNVQKRKNVFKRYIAYLTNAFQRAFEESPRNKINCRAEKEKRSRRGPSGLRKSLETTLCALKAAYRKP